MLLRSVFDVKFEVWLAIGVALSVYVIGYIVRRLKRKPPPGPWGLPIVGYLPFLAGGAHFKFMELAKKYGDVFSVKLGSEDVVVLNGTAPIREAFVKAEFQGRPPHSAFAMLGSKSPFFMSDMRKWQEQRRFVVHTMKDLGLGKSKIEEQIQDEIHHFQDVLKSYRGIPMDLIKPLTPSMSNNICSLVFGKRYDYNDPDRKMLDDNLESVSKVIGQTASHIFFAWIRYIPFILKWLNYDQAVACYKKSDDYFLKKVEEHKETLDPKNIRDFVDGFLVEMEARKAKDPNTTFSIETLVGNVSDLFGAGSETVRTSISWCVYIMAAYPDVQRKVQKEILEVLGPDRSPELQDQKVMPYTQAVIHEIIRWKTIVPLNILRYTLEDTTVSGYDIPKGTTVIANFWAVHHDPKNWKDPDSFKPERFLAPDEKSIIKSQNYMPFSVGKRACPGETMAYMEIFLYFVSILQKFDIKFPKGYKPTYDAQLFATYRLDPYKICLISRN